MYVRTSIDNSQPDIETLQGIHQKDWTIGREHGWFSLLLRKLQRIIEATDSAKHAWLDAVGSLWLRAASGGGAQTDRADAIEAARIRACSYKRDIR